jgi:hypothetical protein
MSFYCPEDPLDLCRFLRLGFDEAQGDIMLRLATARGTLDERITPREGEFAEGDVRGDVLRAVLTAVLWRTLRVSGLRTTMLAPPAPGRVVAGMLGTVAMAYMAEVCRCRDVTLAEVTALPEWNRLELGPEAGWEIRMIPCNALIAAEAARRSRIAVIIDAGNSEPCFVEAQKALEGVLLDRRGLFVRLW